MSIPVTISYQDLRERSDGIEDRIEAAFGDSPDALGVIIVEDLPSEYPHLRERLLRQAAAFAALPEDRRQRYARPEVLNMFGWSHGVEKMNGRPDYLKGSYYANPLLDSPNVPADQKRDHAVYYSDNVWPDSDEVGLDDLEGAFKQMGRMVYDVGLLVARACEGFVSNQLHSAAPKEISVEELIASSQCNKARLLHYFPPGESPSLVQEESEDDACGLHLDHSLLTGLCSAMYLSHPSTSALISEPRIVPPPDSRAGLYVKPRSSISPSIKISIPSNALAFQVGEALSLMTGGRLRATPHYVSAGRAVSRTDDPNGPGEQERRTVSRETFAFFLQPDVDRVIGPDGETFGEFSKRILAEHY